jgi:hypothetical protein
MPKQTAGEWALSQRLKEEGIDELIKRLNDPVILPSLAVQEGFTSVEYSDIFAAIELVPVEEAEPEEVINPVEDKPKQKPNKASV